MSAWWVISLFVVLILISVVNSKFDLDTPIRIARCRASCLYKMKTAPDSDTKCKKTWFCSQCWKSCGALQARTSSSRMICANKKCGPGCLEACRFHPLSSHIPPVPVEEMLAVNDSRVSWPSVPGVVYVVMGEGAPLLYTLEPRGVLPSGVDLATVRVLVVDWRGLVKVFAPGAESPVDQALHILRSLGMERVVRVTQHDTPGEDLIHQIITDNSWRVSLLSLHHQTPLVLAQIGWEPFHDQLSRSNQSNISYLVSWTAQDDVVRGNLLTNTSTVTLSLWPDTMYRIQVALFSLETTAIQSEPMTLDTHRAQTTFITTSTLPTASLDLGVPSDSYDAAAHKEDHHGKMVTQGGSGNEVVAGVSAAVLVFLGVVLAATWRWRHRLYLPHNKLVDEETAAPNIYRVFPPAMRLIGDLDRTSDMFSSQDQLLQHQ